MAVRIMVDDLGLYQSEGTEEVLSPEVNAVHAVRERIRYRLRDPEPLPLVLRMSSAIFRRFADLEGAPGLVVERISPRRALRERLGCPLPPWLSDDLAVMIGAFGCQVRASDAEIDPTDRVLALMGLAQSQVPDLPSLLTALSQQPPEARALLAMPEVKQRLKECFETAGITVAEELVTLFTEGPSPPREVYRTLALATVRERLDELCSRDGLSPDFALPPRQCSMNLVRQLPSLTLSEVDAAAFPDYLRRLLTLAERRTHGGLPIQSLADYMLQDWPGVFEGLQALFEQNPGIATEPMVRSLTRVGGASARDLAVRMQEYLDHSHCDPLPRDASVKDVLRWSEGYFRYAIGAFERHAEPDEAVGVSFARWVSGEQNRIIQSEYDWRVVARTVEQELAAGHLVILCVIDALGAIHMDLVELELRQRLSDQAAPVIKPLFAPLPTITEVGKIGVLTGRANGTQSADYEKALRDRYVSYLSAPGSLQIIKSWKDFREALRPSTRLLVCLDNRVDDDLHKSTEYRLHRERVRTVAAQLADLIANWLLDAGRFGIEATILITADHGATKVSRSVPVLPGTVPVEGRLLQVAAAPDPVPEGFAYAPVSGTLGGWLIPYGRVGFGSTTNLLHGGLTPEEVLIPFMRIARRGTGSPSALILTPAEALCHAATNGWHATLSLGNSTNDSFFNLKVVAQQPFSGESQLIARLGPYETQAAIILKLSSPVEQQGKTQVCFELRYQPGDGATYERLLFNLDLDLGVHLIERTAAAKDFDAFFDL
jgi:hypothetical protein